METNSKLVIFALVAAFGLVTVVAVDIMLTAQEAEARGCRTSIAFNASKGRCFQPGPAAELTAVEENQVEESQVEENQEDDEDQEADDNDEEDEAEAEGQEEVE